MDQAKLVEFLRQVDVMQSLSDDDLGALAAVASERTFAPGATLFHEGDACDGVLVLVDGRIRCTRGGAEITEIQPREAFGVSSFLDAGPRNVDAVAVGTARVLRFERSALQAIVYARPAVRQGLFSVMTRHLRSVLDVAAARRAFRG